MNKILNIVRIRPKIDSFIRYLYDIVGKMSCPSWEKTTLVSGVVFPSSAPNFINDLNSAIIFSELINTLFKETIDSIFTDTSITYLWFFDEVNAVHNLLRGLARNNIIIINNRDIYTNKYAAASPNNCIGITTLSITQNNNFSTTLVQIQGA